MIARVSTRESVIYFGHAHKLPLSRPPVCSCLLRWQHNEWTCALYLRKTETSSVSLRDLDTGHCCCDKLRET